RGAASSRGGKHVGRGGAVVGLSQATSATDIPASPVSYAQFAKQLIAPMPVHQFPSYAEKLKQAKQERTAAV
ncbi:hypothetical protein HDU81_007784, partial [Chytriomyces hyalinus]